MQWMSGTQWWIILRFGTRKNGEKVYSRSTSTNSSRKKMEASGWPSKCYDEKTRKAFVREVKEKEDIQLDFTKIEINPGSSDQAYVEILLG